VEVVVVAVGLALCAVAMWAVVRLRPSRRQARAGTTDPKRIDPFTLGEPWRRHVAAAQSAQRRFTTIVASLSDGPLRTRMAGIGRQVDRGVAECFAIARHGDRLDDTIRNLDGPALRARLDRATDPATRSSLENQLASLERIRSARTQTDQRLHALQNRLGELVGQAAEVSLGADRTPELGSAVDDVVVQLQALLEAVDEVNTTGRSRGFDPGPGTAAPTT
jgi:hypothetical protein